MTIQIVEILGRAAQGATLPFKCRCEDGQLYYVKGYGAGRTSLINEYVCGTLAQSFGLPIAEFEIVDVPSELVTWGGAELQELRAGLAFGSKALPQAQEFTVSNIRSVPLPLRKDIVLFDWWIQNKDRTLSELGGNPNLLWNQGSRCLSVIDHNQAFDKTFNATEFANHHVFHADLPPIFDDMVERVAYADRLAGAIAEFETACDNIPDEWWWVDDGVPALFDRNEARQILERYTTNEFWRVA